MEKVTIYQIDSFTDCAFKGNPAAVCIIDKPLSDEVYQDIAAEMNLSETAFVVKQDTCMFSIRYFTPTTEVSLCGHATLASAKVLFDESLVPLDKTIVFNAKEDVLECRMNQGKIEMDFPLDELTQIQVPSNFVENTNIAPIRLYKTKSGFYLAELISEAAVQKAKPNLKMMVQEGIDPLLITARAHSGEYDFVSRVFAPGHGIDEDPVTGNAHRSFAMLWSSYLNKLELIGKQISKRTGIVEMQIKPNSILIRGNAVHVFKGEMQLPDYCKTEAVLV